jgi:hypothetical protein
MIQQLMLRIIALPADEPMAIQPASTKGADEAYIEQAKLR